MSGANADRRGRGFSRRPHHDETRNERQPREGIAPSLVTFQSLTIAVH
jgi:hypothetical protein